MTVGLLVALLVVPATAAVAGDKSLIARLPPSQTLATGSLAQAPVPPTPSPVADNPAPPVKATSLGAASLIIILAIALIIGSFALPRWRRRT